MTLERCIKGTYVIAIDVECGEGTEIYDFADIKHCTIGKNNKIWNHVNIYKSTIGDDNVIGSHVEIGGAKIGSHNKIEAMTFIPPGVTIGDFCFVGPSVRFANDKYPKVSADTWSWTIGKVTVGSYVSIGINSTILPNVTIGDHSFIAAGSLVAGDVPPNSFAMGRPAHVVSMQTMKELGVL